MFGLWFAPHSEQPPPVCRAGRGSSRPSPATRPLGDPGRSPAAAARHAPPPPDDATVSRLRGLPGCEEVAGGEWLNPDQQLEVTDSSVIDTADIPRQCEGDEAAAAPVTSHTDGCAALEAAMCYVEQQPEATPVALRCREQTSLSQQERGRRLIEAAREGAAEQLRELLAAGADVGARQEEWGSSQTALHWAARGGHVAAASCLVGAGAEVDARSSWGQWTPLHWAAFNGHAGVVRLLVGASADVNARDRWGQTPLHRAALWGHAEAAAELLLAGADRGARDERGRTPLDLARQNRKQELVDMLTQR
ncbi:poly [ADP-ribose] polymerase tankyrase-1-like [Schistocerca piceifrons]|uniref:poly [ADP-ribose] polymerase tankyrase-1-like n=1 Tax=Schistocerca piceifrons TaxID=274613 RepID=UPI001F5EBDF6|nr:poly [ADP-ribose] polymerase tankyrase-1-like [Schistocerca piceifrons]